MQRKISVDVWFGTRKVILELDKQHLQSNWHDASLRFNHTRYNGKAFSLSYSKNIRLIFLI